MDDLDARLVILGLWEGAVVHLTEKARNELRRNERAVCFGPGDRPGSWLVTCERPSALHGGVLASRTFDLAELLLVLPGPRGSSRHCLKEQIYDRTRDERGPCNQFPRSAAAAVAATLTGEGLRDFMPYTYAEDYEAHDALFHAVLWHPAKVSAYLAMTDALAKAQGWDTGPGAPVYAWTRVGQGWCLGQSGAPGHARGAGYSVRGIRPVPALEGITDPMAALEATWRTKCSQ